MTHRGSISRLLLPVPRPGILLAAGIVATTLIPGFIGPTRLFAAARANEITLQLYISGYTFFDNTPPGSTRISNPVLHSNAGGTGTYSDPITVAVGHSLASGNDVLDFPTGTKFYIPNLRRYFIVEDTCGDGQKPQNGPCHTGYPAGTSAWLDVWVDGASGTESSVQACSEKLTDSNGESHTVIENPTSNYLVMPGSVFQNGACSQMYGNKIITTSAPVTSPQVAPTQISRVKQASPSNAIKAAPPKPAGAKDSGLKMPFWQNAAILVGDYLGTILASALVIAVIYSGIIFYRRRRNSPPSDSGRR